MPKFVPVPWIRWQRFRVRGVVRDDYLGEAETDASGNFEIRFTDADFKGVESKPDLYLCVFAPGTPEPVHDTSFRIRWNASNDEYYEIAIANAPSTAPQRAKEPA